MFTRLLKNRIRYEKYVFRYLPCLGRGGTRFGAVAKSGIGCRRRRGKHFIRSSRRALRAETWQNQTRLALGIPHPPSRRCRPAGHALVQLSCVHVYFFFNFTSTALGSARVEFPGFHNLPISVFFFFAIFFFFSPFFDRFPLPSLFPYFLTQSMEQQYQLRSAKIKI